MQQNSATTHLCKPRIDLLTGFLIWVPHRLFHTSPSPCTSSKSAQCLDNITEAHILVYKEVSLGRILGPYIKSPFLNLICSPLNLVPKAGNPGKFQLIHNLAFPYNQNSVNVNIPDCHAKVSYQKFDVVVQLALKHGPGCYAGKNGL